MSVTVSPVVQSVTVSPVVQSVTIGTVASGGVTQSYVDTLTDNYWDSPTLQVLIFDGAQNPNVETDPLRTHFVTTYGSWVGSVSPATTPIDPTGIGGSVTYVNNTCVLSTNPTATAGNSRADMRNSRPNVGPGGGAPPTVFIEHAWHIKIDACITAYVPASFYTLGFYRTHGGAVNVENLLGFIADPATETWHIKIVVQEVDLLDFDTGVDVTERHTFEVIQQQANISEVLFRIDGVLIDCGFTTWTDYYDSSVENFILHLFAGAAVRDNQAPQTVISSLTIYEMILKCKAHTGVLPHTHPTTDIQAGLAVQDDVMTYKTVGGWSYEQPKIGEYFMSIGTALERQNLQYDGTTWVNRKDSYYGTRHADHSISSSTAVQDVFHGANNAFPLDANSTWLFEGSYVIGSGTTSHTTAIGFTEFGSGICNFTVISSATSAYGTVTRAQDMTCFNSSAGGPINSATTSVLVMINFTGRITVVDATNFVPTLTFSAAPTGTCAVKSGSWIKLTRLWTGESVFADPEWA